MSVSASLIELDGATCDLTNDSQSIVKKKKSNLTSDDAIIYQGVISSQILSKANKILQATDIPDRADADNVKVSYIEEKNSFKASIYCPVASCKKLIALSFSYYLSLTMYSFKRHVSSVHLNLKSGINTDKSKMKQPSIKDAFGMKTKQPSTSSDHSLAMTAETTHDVDGMDQ